MTLATIHHPFHAASGGFLSAEEAGARTRPLRAWTSQERSGIALEVGNVLEGWRKAWSVVEPRLAAHGPECITVVDAGPGVAGWRPLGGHGAWWALRDGDGASAGVALALRELSRGLYADALPLEIRDGPLDPVRGLADEVLHACWIDACTRLRSVLRAAGEAPRDSGAVDRESAPWSGDVVVEIPWWSARLRLLLSGDVTAVLVRRAGGEEGAPSRALVPLWEALRRQRVRVAACLEHFELSVGALQSLRDGAVLRTAHALHRSLDLVVRGEDVRTAALCSAFLGTTRGLLAVELSSRGSGDGGNDAEPPQKGKA